MTTLLAGNSASFTLGTLQSLNIKTGGTGSLSFTSSSEMAQPSFTASVANGDFGPYNVSMAVVMTMTSGSADYTVVGGADVTVVVDPVTGGMKIAAPVEAGRTVVLLGDSITNQNVITPGGGYGESYNAAGYFVQANMALGWPLTIVADAGVSSETSAQILARVESDVLQYSPDWCVVMAGTNDLSSVDADTTIANLQAIYVALINAGVRVVACTITPSTAHTSTPAYGFKRKTINQWIKTFAMTTANMVVADTERAIVDPATGGPLSGYTYDGTHPSCTGARAMGRAIAEAMTKFVYAPSRSAAYDNGFAINPMMNGSNSAAAGGFTAQTGITGVGPNGLDAEIRNTGAAVGSKTTRSNDWRPETIFRLACSFTANYDGVGVSSGGSDRSGVAKGRYDQAWAATTAYQQNDRKRPTVANGYHYVATTAGTTGGSEPTWPTTEGSTVVDSGVTWRCHATPVDGDKFIAVAEVDLSSVSGGIQLVLNLTVGFTDGTYQDIPTCGYQDLGGAYSTPALNAPSSMTLVTPELTLATSGKTLRYLFARLRAYGTAGGSANVDIARLDIVKTN